GRNFDPLENSRSAPARSNFFADQIDLRLGQHPARTLRKSRHRGSVHAFGNNFAYGDVVCDRQIDGVGESDGSAPTSFRTVTAGAVLPIQRLEIHNFTGSQDFGIAFRLGELRTATGQEKSHEYR